MSHAWKLAARAGIAGLALAAAAAQAQVYRCGSGKQTTYSSTPCAGTRHNDQMGAIGPSGSDGQSPAYGSGSGRSGYGRSSASSYYGNPNRIEDLPDHYAYLSPSCKALNDAMRTAASRGLGGDTMADLRREWHGRCEDDDMQARRSLLEARQADRDRREAAQVQAQARRDESDAQRERCDEMLRILARKRKRTDLSDGERAELARFEANYQQRCR